jgi:ribosomal protein S18 acetylase RimI-like enzyme
MALSNYERMIQMADEVFASRTDPDQLNVNEEVISHLHQMHPAAVSEYDDGNGPAAWILGFPTTLDLMNRFLENKISEKELYERTPLNIPYEALYLCSAMVLPEYRRKGIAEKLTLKAIESIRKDQPIKALFVWAFSKEGEALAEKIAARTGLPLKNKQSPN